MLLTTCVEVSARHKPPMTQIRHYYINGQHQIHMQALQILKSHGLARCADELCEKLSLKTMQDLADLTDERIDTLTFLHEHQPRKLKTLCQACREGDPNYINDVLRRRHDGLSSHQRLETLLAKLGEI